MPKSTKSPGRKYPKPYAGFPLSAHTYTNRWYKTFNGRRYYYGPLDNWQEALRCYEHWAPQDAAGEPRIPMGETADTSKSVAHLCNAFMEAKARQVEAGEMTPRSLAEYHGVVKVIAATLGRSRSIDTLTPDDFGKLRAALSKGTGGKGKTGIKSPVVLGNLITRARSVFKWGVDNGITDKAIRYGTQFSKPKRRAVKLARREQPVKFFEADEIHAMLDAADKPLRAMVLLACNCGLGNADLNQITVDDLDLDAGLLDMYRRKTGEERRAVLWPETVAAIRKALETRPEPKDEALADRVFITTHGREWIRADVTTASDGSTKMSRSDNVGQRFNTLRKKAGIDPKGRGFYTIRHTFRSVADAVPDRPAVDLCMGHESSADIRTSYVDPRSISVERLQAVADHVRGWLWYR